MYYGRSLDDLAPKYVIDTVRNLKSRRTKLRELEQKRDKLEADYAKLSEKEQYAKHGELDTARKLAEDALLDITKIVGGFLVVDDLDPVIADHGNADNAINPDGSPNTAHSLNPVPIIVVSDRVASVADGVLADVAPTVLALMGLPQPKEMTGKALVSFK